MRHPMRRGRWSLLLIVPASAAPAFGVGGVTNASSEGEPVVVGDLAYFTGDFSEVGPSLAAQVDFPIAIINEDPPLGRPWEVIHEDIGTVGEGQAARKLLEADGVDILVSPAHEYFTYRDFALDWVASNEGPIMPTVHGGVIPGNVGGTPEEPIFRAQGLDEGQGVTTVLYAQQLGAESIVVMTTPAAGYQLSADAIENTAAELGIEVLDRIDAPGDQPSYRAEIQRALDAGADAIIVQAQPVESGTMVRQAAEAGTSTVFIGEATWVEQEFVDAAGTEAFAFHEVVAFPGFGKQENAAWEFFQPAWDDNPEYSQYNAADDFYAYTTYDLLTITALAVEHGGGVEASLWAPAMFEVTDAPGTQCFTYAECVALIRAGDDIDYEGITGPGTFTDGGVNAVTPVVRVYGDDGTVVEEVEIDSEQWLELLDQVAQPFEE